MYARLAKDVATQVHSPGIHATAVLNPVYVAVTPEDPRLIKIAFTPAKAGSVQLDVTLINQGRKPLDTLMAIVPIANSPRTACNAFFQATGVWFQPVG
ncbi:hypothetical protein [Kitasatospora cheerisanensis]|uniref:Uncharacterized protein n=1 Tax=Kitasatospora cheerisanensis KCTC 2395 TaxID=1348663 RepID=A0A066Z0G1_9ACTN|nr:hypothetical protein [Kitasatospora cheerisanensis]KDN85704.1 hypothetical protein KCH_25320 [Kitasatospora cheerisanensis KCTC 2395]